MDGLQWFVFLSGPVRSVLASAPARLTIRRNSVKISCLDGVVPSAGAGFRPGGGGSCYAGVYSNAGVVLGRYCLRE